MPNTLAALEAQVESELRPATALERWFAKEIAYASWELDRVRENANQVEAEATLSAVYSRASRNWNRARKEFTRIQTTRANQLVRVDDAFRPVAAIFPMADPARIPLPGPAKVMNKRFVPTVMNAIDAELASFKEGSK